MKRNTVIQLLRLLSKEEITKLGKFLRSPYFNNSKPIIALFEQYRKLHPDYLAKRIKPHKFWEKIYPDKPFSEQQYWWLTHKLRTLIEQFLIAEETLHNPQTAKQQLIHAYRQRNAHPLFEKETISLLGELEKQPFQDIHSYASSLWLKHDYFFNPLTDKYGGAHYSVEDAMEELDRFYILAKLRFAAEIKNRERIFFKKVPIKLLDECLMASDEYMEKNPAFLMYKNVLDLYEPEKAETAFHKGKKLLENKFSFLSMHDQNEVMLNLRNYAIRQLNKGKINFWREIFELYKLGFKLDLIVVDGKISEATFGNIVKAGCVAKEFDWTENFIKSHEEHLDEEVRKDAKALSHGVLFLHKKEYEKAIDLLNNHEFSQILHQMNGRTTTIKAWFYLFKKDKNLYDVFLSKLSANEKYFRRLEKVTDQRKEYAINFILAVKKMTDLIFMKIKIEEIKIKMNKYLSGNKLIGDKLWILEKVHEL